MADLVCKHERKQLIAKDDDSQYWECLDCGEILEAAELSAEPPPQLSAKSAPGPHAVSLPERPVESPTDPEKHSGPGESLSDA